MSLIVRNPGVLSLVQDSGRSSFQRYGVSVSGAMDQEALLIGNLLVGNSENSAVIEVTFGGAEFELTKAHNIAITGADLSPTLDGTPVPLWESFVAPEGSALGFSAPANGLRAYISVAGGIDTEPVLGSRSTHVGSKLGGVSGGPLVVGDEIPVDEVEIESGSRNRLPEELRPQYSHQIVAHVVLGPQQAAFTADGIETFLSSTYEVTESSDRQGVRLEGPVIEAVGGRYDIVSDAVVFGAIQIPGDGKPIVLLADRQTTGGYAKIGVVASVDLPLLAQATPGTTIGFSEISVSKAQSLLRHRLHELRNAELAMPLKTADSQLLINGRPAGMSLTYSPERLSDQDGELVSAEIDGVSHIARALEVE